MIYKSLKTIFSRLRIIIHKKSYNLLLATENLSSNNNKCWVKLPAQLYFAKNEKVFTAE